MYRLERSNKPVVNAKLVGSNHVPKRVWKLFCTYPMPVHPSALSSAGDSAQNMMIGARGQQVRLVKDDRVIAIYEWARVMENPGEPDTSNTVWGWKVISQAPVTLPERTHVTSAGVELLPAPPSVGIDNVVTISAQHRDYMGASGPTYPKDDEMQF